MDKMTGKVQMLGGFSLTLNGITIADQNSSMKKPWNILEYLITFRNRDVSSSELIDLVWNESESVNPAGALKTLMFRVRKLLEPTGLPTHSLIIQKRGAYAWNPDVALDVDIDEFESLCKRSNLPDVSEDKQLEMLTQALELYRGDFLPKACWEDWVNPINTYYHSQYLQAARRAIEILSARSDWDGMIRICQKGLQIERFDEDLHYYLILALYKNGSQRQAMEHYQYTIDLFYDEFALTPSDRLRNLYKTISQKKNNIIMDISALQESMKEDSFSYGAFYCESSVFSDIYRLERRSIERTGDSIYLCLLSLHKADGALPSPAILSRAMTKLGTATRGSLRRGDVYTRYNVCQYLILLPTASFENGDAVMQRIARTFHRICQHKDVDVSYALQAVTPEEPAM